MQTPPKPPSHILAYGNGIAAMTDALGQDARNVLPMLQALAGAAGFLIAKIEPEQARKNMYDNFGNNLAQIVQAHVTSRNRTPGGIIIPKGGEVPKR